MGKGILLYLGGGCMSGVFGAGVVTSILEKNLDNEIEAVYGASAGSINAAYFLSKQVKLGSSIYFDDLTHDFIIPSNTLYIIFQKLWSKYIHKIPEYKIVNDINIDYLMKIIQNSKRLDINEINKNKIKFYVELLNPENGRVYYIHVNGTKIIKMLHAAISVPPYYSGYEKIYGKEFIDSMGVYPTLKYLLKKYPDKKIIFCLNHFPDSSKAIRFEYFFEGLFGAVMYGKKFYNVMMKKEEFNKKEIEIARKNKNVLLIYPPRNNPTKPWTTDRGNLLKTYELGKNEADKIKRFIYPI